MAAVLKKARRKLPPAPFESKANREAEHGIRAALHRAFIRLRAKLAEQLRHESWRKQAVRKGYDPDQPRDDHGRFGEGSGEKPTREQTTAWASGVKERLGLEDFSVYQRADGSLHLNYIVVPKDQRDAGVGSKAVNELTAYADKHGMRITLDPASRGDRGTTSRSRLVRFYRQFGFVENKGRNKDFTISDGMYRDPKKTKVAKGEEPPNCRCPSRERTDLVFIGCPCSIRQAHDAWLVADRIGKAAGDEEDPEWLIAGEIAARLDLGELAFVVDDVGSALDVVASSASSATLGAIGVDDQRIVDQIDQAAADWARDRSAELVGMRYDAEGNLVEAARASMRIDESTRNMVRETIYQGLVEGKRSTEIADDLESGSRETEYPFSEERAALIANTEIRRAHNEGSLSGMRGAIDAGVDVKKSWITSGHDTVCDECEENEAIGAIDVEDEFPSGDDAAPAHPSCNCDIIAEVAETASEQED